MTRYSAWPPWAARSALVLLLVLTVVGALSKPPPMDHFGRPPEWRDWMLHRSIVGRVMKGESYYAAAAAEHRLHRYPTTPPEVFREPTLAWFLAALRSDPVRRGVLFALSLVTLVALWFALARSGIGHMRRAIAFLLIGGGVALAWTPISPYSHEIWAGLLIALSLASYAPGRWRLAILLGLIAACVRELSVLYLVVMAAFAFHEQSWREFRDWLAAILSFAVLFVVHLSIASGLYRPGDLTFTSAGWFHFGGWPFVVEASKLNLFIYFAPRFVAAIWAVLAVLGFVGVRDRWLSRTALIVCGYMVAFLIVGLPGNAYWGLLYVPLFPIGVVLAPEALSELISRAVPKRGSPRPVPD